MIKVKQPKTQRYLRRTRIRGRIFGTAKRPRLSVFRSSKHIYAQIVNDEKGVTLVSSSDSVIKNGNKTGQAFEMGKELAKRAKSKKIKEIVFDRGGYAYQGRVKAVAEGAREGGLEF